MTALLLICAGMLGFSLADRSDYQAAAARAGRDAGAHLKLAVWCEAHGMDPERLKHLATALAIDPQNAAARGLMGLVSYGGRWLPPEKVGESVKADEAMAARLAEYEGKRRTTPETAEAQWRLALWCEKNGLKAEATAHFTIVTQIDTKRADAWRKLGCQFVHGRWISAEQVAAERAEDQAQWKADMYWEPILMRWRNDLGSSGPRRERAIVALNEITDPRAVPSIHKVLARGNRAHQEMAAQMLGRIQCPASSHALLALSLFHSWPEGRSFAIRELKRRDPRDYMDELIGMMHRPFAYHVTPVGPLGEPGTLVIDGDQTQIQRIYRVPGLLIPEAGRRGPRPANDGGQMGAIGPPGPAAGNRLVPENPLDRLREIVLRDQQSVGVLRQTRQMTQQTLQRDIAIVESFNARLRVTNRIVGGTLGEITGQPLGDDPDAWLTWWNDSLGLRYERTEPKYKKTAVQYVRVPFPVHHSCFAAGTPVTTLTGPRPIESLHVGDVVLSQDTETGVLGYQPILGVHHNQPAETVRIRLKDETLVSTPVHRFWRPGRGWAMARDLSPGDSVRTVGGRAEIVEIKPDDVQPVFNLDVARTHSFFVGSGKLLVCDNSLPPALFTPFDAEPSLVAEREEVARPAEEHGAGIPPSPSRPKEGGFAPGSIWEAGGASSSRPRASSPGPRAFVPGSIWGAEAGSTSPGQPKASKLAPRPVEPSDRSPR